MVLMFKDKQMFLRCFYDNTVKYFYDSLNTVVILTPDFVKFSLLNVPNFL